MNQTLANKLRMLNNYQLKVAYYLAFDISDEASIYMHKFSKTFGIDAALYRRCCDKLKTDRLAKDIGWYPHRVSLYPEERMGVLEHMFVHSPDLYAKYLKVFDGSATVLSFMSMIRYALTGKNPPPSGKLPAQVLEGLLPYIEEPWISRVLEYASPEDIIWLIDNSFFSATLSGHLLSREVVERLCLTTYRQPMIASQIQELKDLYLYLAYGDYNITEVPKTRNPWTITTAAIHATLDGDYQYAVDLFASAFKILNRESKVKNMFFDLFPQYYYVMALIHLDNSTSQTKLKQFDNKKEAHEYVSLMPALFLTRIYLNAGKIPAGKSTIQMLTAGHNTPLLNVRYMGQLFDRYYDINADKGELNMPEYAIMRHELSKYLNLTDSERQDLITLYGNKPALTSINRKQLWELLIDDVMKSANLEVSPSMTPQKSSRIVYVRRISGYFDIKHQTVLKSGAWSKPRPVNFDNFINCTIEYMDEADQAIATVLKHLKSQVYHYDLSLHAYSFIPKLIGSDRVFALNNREDLTSIEVVEETPVLNFEKTKDGGFRVCSNVTLEALRKVEDGYITIQQGDFKYAVMRIDQRQRIIYEKLLAAPSFPIESKDALQKFLTYLDGVVTVSSPLLDSSAMLTVDGSSRLAIKMSPTAGLTYLVGLYVKPLDDGSVYCVPGSGNAVIYDSNADGNVRVKRNLKGEKANLQRILDVLDSEEHPMIYDEAATTIEAEQMLDLLEFVRLNPDAASIEWPEGKAVTLKSPLSQASWNVGLKSDNGWFDIEGDVRVDENTVIKMSKLLDIIASDRGRYVRLGENDFVQISNKLRRQLERIEALAVRNRNKLQISNFNAALLDKEALNGEIKISYDDSLPQLQNRIIESHNLNLPIPKTLNATLRPYQVEGFQWMARLASWGAGACLADDMGLGKTVQTIAFLLSKASEGPALVVAPASVVPNWHNEIERFAPSLHVEILNKAVDRGALIKEAGSGDVIVTTYGLLNTEVDDLAAKEWTTICLDEAHTIKNRDTKMSRAAMELNGKYRLALTGTPIQNHLGELWNLFNFINPGLLGNFDTFRQKYVAPITMDNDKVRRRALQRIIKPFMLRRTKSEVIDDLPEKTDIILPVELSDDELSFYEALRAKAVKALEEATTLDVNTLSEITKLRQAACTPQLIDKDWIGMNSKIQAFMELVQDFKGDNNRMLVFSQFTSFLALVRKALDDAGEPYLYLDGSTPMKQRERLVEEFQQGDCPIFLISLKAGGLGLNLTGANYVVHLDPWWNPAIEQQATDRTYRIGQMRNVTVYHLLAKNTIEEKIRRLHQTKRDLADSLLEGTDMAGKLTVKDILELVKDA